MLSNWIYNWTYMFQFADYKYVINWTGRHQLNMNECQEEADIYINLYKKQFNYLQKKKILYMHGI